MLDGPALPEGNPFGDLFRGHRWGDPVPLDPAKSIDRFARTSSSTW